MLLSATMRKTLLGKQTMHGYSQLASKIMTQRKIRKDTSRTGDDLVKQAFESIYVEEEMKAVEEELSLSGLNFSVTRSRAMKKWRFFLCVVILQLFSAFQVRRRGPAKMLEDGMSITVGDCRDEDNKLSALPLSSVWYYMPPNVSLVTDCHLIEAFQKTLCDPAAGACETVARYGWDQPQLDIQLSDDAVTINLNTSEACQFSDEGEMVAPNCRGD